MMTFEHNKTAAPPPSPGRVAQHTIATNAPATTPPPPGWGGSA